MKNVMTNKGDATVKIHMQKTSLFFSKEKNIWFTRMGGVGTECNSNAINKETFNDFHATYKQYPEMCCKKCVKSYLEMMKKGGRI
jgi:hypothetical protein